MFTKPFGIWTNDYQIQTKSTKPKPKLNLNQFHTQIYVQTWTTNQNQNSKGLMPNQNRSQDLLHPKVLSFSNQALLFFRKNKLSGESSSDTGCNIPTFSVTL
jgi:hypothetical protein